MHCGSFARETKKEGIRMKKRIAILLAVVCSLALCFALVGCGGGKGEDASKNFVGDWVLVGGEADGEVIDAEMVDMLNSFGMQVYLSLKDDGTATLVLFGEEMDGTWKAKDASTVTLTFDGSSADSKLADNKLTLEVEGDKLIFEKGDVSKSATSGSSGTGSSATTGSAAGSAAGNDGTVKGEDLNVTIANDDICTIVVTGTEQDWAGDVGYNMTITNNSDRIINVYASYGSFSVAGKMMELYGGETIKPGKYVDTFMYFSSSDLSGGLEGLYDVEGVLSVTDDDTWDTIVEYDFVM